MTLPALANAAARLTAMVDLPTPPLPEATAITVLMRLKTAGISVLALLCGAFSCAARWAVKMQVTETTPANFCTACSACVFSPSSVSGARPSTSMEKPILPSRSTRPCTRSAAISDCASPLAVIASKAARISFSTNPLMVKKPQLKLEFTCHVHHIDLYMMLLSINAKIALLLHKCHIATHLARAYKSVSVNGG